MLPSLSINLTDQAISSYLFSLHTPALVSFFSLVSVLGNRWSVTCITILIFGWLFFRKKYRLAGVIVLGVSGAALTTFYLKLLFARPRPDLLLNQLDTFSFPSGHATSAFALYGTLLYIVSKLNGNSYATCIVSGFLVLVIFLIGMSRVYLGYHYLSDVLVGYVVGLVWLLLSIWLFKLHR